MNGATSTTIDVSQLEVITLAAPPGWDTPTGGEPHEDIRVVSITAHKVVLSRHPKPRIRVRHAGRWLDVRPRWRGPSWPRYGAPWLVPPLHLREYPIPPPPNAPAQPWRNLWRLRPQDDIGHMATGRRLDQRSGRFPPRDTGWLDPIACLHLARRARAA